MLQVILYSVGATVLAVIALAAVSCCIMAGRADEQIEHLWDDVTEAPTV